MLFLVLLGAAVHSQTVTLAPAVLTSPGENISVPLNVTGFTGIGAITFYIQFDPAVMDFNGITLPSGSPGGFLPPTVTGNVINIVGTWSTFVTFGNAAGDGKLMDLKFFYKGMTTSPLNFLHANPTNCEVTQGLTVIYPTYTNGSVSMNTGLAQKANLVPATAATGGNVTIPLEYTSLPSVAAITQKVHYDPTKLTFVSVTGIGTLLSGMNYNSNASTGVITITWTNTNSGGANVNANSNKFLLNFVYIGSTVTNVDFIGGCLISTPTPVTNVPISYSGGTVSLAAPTATAVLGSITTAVQGIDFEVPVTLTGFPDGPSGGTQAFTLTIPYDSPRLSFIGIASPVPSGLFASQASGTLTITWSDPTAPIINGIFFKLKFKYNGIGQANVSFGNSCVFNTYNSGVVGTVQVAYTNATVTPALAPSNATLGYVTGVSGSAVEIPISFSGLPLSMGAADIRVSYDFTKLSYIDAINTKPGTVINLDLPNHRIYITWSNPAGADINGEFLKLRFDYSNGGGCGAAVSFNDGCLLTGIVDPTPPITVQTVPANWIQGGIDLLFKISGILTYDAPSSAPLDGVTIQIKNGAEPIPPAIAPLPATLYTATTDANGYYEVFVPNGSYYIYASTTKAWDGVDGSDVTNIRRYIALLSSTLNSPLRLRSADVSQSGTIDGTDVTAIRRRIALLTPNPSFKAPDWIFQNPNVLINCANLPNQNFTGLCSGDVNGSY